MPESTDLLYGLTPEDFRALSERLAKLKITDPEDFRFLREHLAELKVTDPEAYKNFIDACKP